MDDLNPTQPKFVKSARDLVTSHEATRQGFLGQALAKTEKATLYVEEAKQLWLILPSLIRSQTSLSGWSVCRLSPYIHTLAQFRAAMRPHLLTAIAFPPVQHPNLLSHEPKRLRYA